MACSDALAEERRWYVTLNPETLPFVLPLQASIVCCFIPLLYSAVLIDCKACVTLGYRILLHIVGLSRFSFALALSGVARIWFAENGVDEPPKLSRAPNWQFHHPMHGAWEGTILHELLACPPTVCMLEAFVRFQGGCYSQRTACLLSQLNVGPTVANPKA